MSYNRETLTIVDGMDVLGSDSEKVGTVDGMRGDYVVVSKGFFFPTDYFIPVSAIASAADDKLYLSVTKDEALNQGWDAEPVDPVVGAREDQPVVDPGLHVDNPVSAGGYPDDQVVDETAQPFDHQADNVGHRDNSDTINVPVTEEELSATTREVERGSVQVDKVVSSDEETVSVPVTEEHVHVTRRAVDQDVAPGDEPLDEGTIEIPVYGEEVEVNKNRRVKEVVEVSKDATTETQEVQDTVRREDVQVTDETGTAVDRDKKRR